MNHKKLSEAELQAKWRGLLREGPQASTLWKHRKSGWFYEVLGLSFRESDLEPMVAYRPFGGEGDPRLSPAFCRPVLEFCERFERVESIGSVGGSAIQVFAPLDVSGLPTPKHLRKGAPGKSYFHAKALGLAFIRVFLDGQEVTARASECDIGAGWVRMYDPDEQGKFVENESGIPIERIHFGKVEVK